MRHFIFTPDMFAFTQEKNEAKTGFSIEQISDGITELHVHFAFPKPTVPEEIRLEWMFPMTDLHTVWTPLNHYGNEPGVSWAKNRAPSRLAGGAPVMAMLNPVGGNLLTVGVSDARTPMELRCGVMEETGLMICNVAFFTFAISPITEYNAIVRLDTRALPFVDTVQAVTYWWETDCGYTRAHVPEAARLPMNSAWYSFHQALYPEEIVHECELSARYGLKTIILDDGWQTDDNSRGYSFCGDWEMCPAKIPDMAELVRRIHDIGMKVVLWYSVPFVGVHSKAFARFRDKALYFNDKDVYVLDVRYPQVRAYLVGIYKKALEAWKLDGFKLDFVDSFQLRPESPAFGPGMDCASLEDAIDALFTEIQTELLAINPELLFEFRQSYIGPVILKYGNFVRVGDCPYNALQNRRAILDLRLTSGTTPVHSDMLMWHPEDTVESACMQILSTLLGVPQISVRFDLLPEAHKKALEFWMAFVTDHRDVLQCGKLSVKNPAVHYSQATTALEREAVTVNYLPMVFEVGTQPRQWLVNATYETSAILRFDDSGRSWRATVYGRTGEIVSETILEAPRGLLELSIPACGMVELVQK